VLLVALPGQRLPWYLRRLLAGAVLGEELRQRLLRRLEEAAQEIMI
jgi:hypothetical protein